ncbi:MAG: PEP-utilizing enzyme, partial [candidate division WOR-3 bacterium]
PKNRYIRMRENCKFLAARYLAMRRFAYLKIGRESGLGDLVFFLKTAELKDAKSKKALAEERKRLFLEQQKLKLPPQFVVVDGKLLGEVEKINEIYGQSVAGQSKVSGRAVFVNSRADFSKKLDGAVLVSKSLIPDLVEVYDKIIGVVSESGGALAHAAVIAREMNLTCVVQAKGIEAIKEGDLIEVDGKTGEIKLQR